MSQRGDKSLSTIVVIIGPINQLATCAVVYRGPQSLHDIGCGVVGSQRDTSLSVCGSAAMVVGRKQEPPSSLLP